MSIRINRVNEIAYNASEKAKFLGMLTNKYGLTCLALFLILVFVESYYRSLSVKSGTIYIGGFGSFVGLIFFVGTFKWVNRSWRKLFRMIKTGEIKEAYYDITDDYLESAIVDYSYHRYSWKSLGKVEENSKTFVLTMRLETQIVVFKSDLKNTVAIEELRAFLAEKVFPRV